MHVDPTFHQGELVYPSRKLEAILTAMEGPFNDNVILCLVGTLDYRVRQEAYAAVKPDLVTILNLRLKLDQRVKPEAGRVAAGFVFQILYDDPFGDYAEVNLPSRVAQLQRRNITMRPVDNVAAAVLTLREFHLALSRACQEGGNAQPLLKMLLWE